MAAPDGCFVGRKILSLFPVWARDLRTARADDLELI
jgi:hypothetical protein